MRIEATVPDSRASAIIELAEQLGLSRSQIVDEALALFLKAVLEIKRGRRLVSQDPTGLETACELTSPTLTTLEWAMSPVSIQLPADALAKMQALIDNPPEPNPRLRAAASRHLK